jgi:hypothetical protein
MKNKTLILAVMISILLLCGSVMAASSVTQTCISYPTWAAEIHALQECTLTITAAADGSVTDYTFPVQNCLFQATTNPGSPAPQDNYDIELLYEGTIDAANAQLMNRDTATSEFVSISPVHCVNDLTLHVTNNNVNGAITVLKLKFGR